MEKRYKIILIFSAIAVVLYFTMNFLTVNVIEIDLPSGNGLMNDLLTTMFYSIVAYGIYFGLLILASIIGWIIGYRRRDHEMVAAYRLLSIALIAFGVTGYLYNSI